MILRHSLICLAALQSAFLALASADSLDQIIQRRQGVVLGTGSDAPSSTPAATPLPTSTSDPTSFQVSSQVSPPASPLPSAGDSSSPPPPNSPSAGSSETPSPQDPTPLPGTSSAGDTATTSGILPAFPAPISSSVDSAAPTQTPIPRSSSSQGLLGGGSSSSSGGSASDPASDSTVTESGSVSTSTTPGPAPIITSTDTTGKIHTLSGSAALKSISHKTVFTTPLVTSRTRHVLTTIIGTTDGHAFTSTASSDEVQQITTGVATVTSGPGLGGDGSGGGSGLSSSAKKTIGGVVGGIGGAIVIGALAFVAWRIWGRKKATPEEDDFSYNSQQASLTQEKRYSHGGSTTLSDGLERYREPAQPNNVNTSSNF